MVTKRFFVAYTKWQKFLIVIFLALIFLQNILSIYNKSPVYDERCYVGSGKYILKNGIVKYSGLGAHPPLSFYLNSIFLLPLKFREDIYASDDCWYVGNEMIYHSGHSPYIILLLARLPNIILSMILSLIVLKFTEKLYGKKSALFAMFLYTFNVTILSHSNLALIDFTVAFFMFVAVFYFWKHMKKQSLKNLLLAGLFLGLALLSKFIAVTLAPSFIILAFIELYQREKLNKKNFFRTVRMLLSIFIIAITVVWIGYHFSFRPVKEVMPDHYVDRAYEEFNKAFSNKFVRDKVIYVFENIPLPFPSYFFEIGFMSNLSKGRERYFFGKVVDHSLWYHPIVIFILKTQLSLIVLLIANFILLRKSKHRQFTNELYLLIPMIFFALFIMFNRITSAISHLIPIYPFLIVLSSNIINFKKIWIRIFLVIIIIHYLLSSVLAFPNYFSYFNEIIGGSKNGYKYLASGNVDNGQSLPQLKEYMNKHNIKKINLSYLGSIDPKEYGVNYDYMPSPFFQPWAPGYQRYARTTDREEDCSKRKGWIVISTQNYQGVYLLNKSCYSWLRDYEPAEKIANGLFVYNITS